MLITKAVAVMTRELSNAVEGFTSNIEETFQTCMHSWRC
jgi:hypothetical protein